MNDRGVLIYEMRKFWNISEQDIERIIGGQAPDGDEALEDIAMFFKDLDETYPEVSTESHESAHIHAMIQTAQLLADNGKPVVRPASKAHGPESQVSGLPNLRRNIMVKVMLASTRVKAAAAGVALVLVFGGTAFAGVLPAPIQDAVADAVKPIGIDLPNPDDSQAAEVKSLNNDIEVEDSGGIDKGDKNDQDSVGAEEDADSNEAEVRTPDTDQADDGDEVDAPDTDVTDDDAKVDAPDTDVTDDDAKVDAPDTDVTDDDAKVDAPDTDVTDDDAKVDAPDTDVTDDDAKVDAPDTDVTDDGDEVDAPDTDQADDDVDD